MSRSKGARLGDVAEFVRGITFKPEDVVPTGTPGSVPCLRTKNVQAMIDLSDVWSVNSRFVRRPDQYLEAGDLLVSSANSWNLVGKCCWVPEEASGSTFGGFIAALRPRRRAIHPRYLFHWFSSAQIQATVRSFGRQTTNISNLDFARCLQLHIPLPGLEEQQRVTTILDNADALRNRRRMAVALLDDLVDSVFLDMFGSPGYNTMGWPNCDLSSLLIGSPQNGLYKPSTEYGAGTPIVRIDSFYSGTVSRIDDLKRVNLTDDEVRRYQLRCGDILINRVNSLEYLGKTALITRLNEPTVFESNMMRFHINTELAHPSFVSALLQSRHIKAQIRRAAKKAVNQASINQTDVGSLEMYLPPLRRQSDFAERVHTIGSIRTRHIAHLAELDALFASLRHRAFWGEQ